MKDIDAKIATLSEVSFLRELRASELAPLARRAISRRYRANEIVVATGEEHDHRALKPSSPESTEQETAALYIVESGSVEVYVDEDGDRLILNSHGSGEFFGELALFDSKARSATVWTLEPTALLIVPGEVFLNFLDAHPKVARAITRYLALRVRALTSLVTSLGLKDVYGQVCHVLLTAPIVEREPLIARRRYTQNEIAERVGASRKMVNRAMRALTQNGYIRMERKRMVMLRGGLPESLSDIDSLKSAPTSRRKASR